MNENPQSNYAWEDRLTWFKSSTEYRDLDTIDGEAMEFDWTQLMVRQWNSSGISSLDSPHCSLSVKSKSSCQD